MKSSMEASKRWLRGLKLASSTPGKVRRRRLLVFLVVSITGVAASWAIFMIVQGASQSSSRLQFEQVASQIEAELQTSFDLSLEHLRSIPPLFAASDEVTRQSFRKFVTPALKRHPSLYVSSIMPRVSASERRAFESAARAEGYEGYVIRSIDADGQDVPLEKHADYFPIYYTEPLVPSVLGIDLGSHHDQAEYVERACETKEPVVTPPLSLIEDPEDVLSVIAFVSIRFADTSPDDPCDGVAVVILRLRPLVENTLGRERLDEYRLVLTDLDAKGDRKLVHKNFPGDAESIHLAGPLITTREIQFADQTWSMTLAPAAGSTFAPAPPYWILGAGGLLTLLAAYSLSARIAIEGLRKQVDEALQLGQYQLKEKIGEGGMGEVYRARHAMLTRPTAVKLLKRDQVSQLALARFEREVQLSSQLTHPNTIQIYDYGRTDEGVFYYAMEYLDGLSLAELIQKHGPLPAGRVLHILSQVCGSLSEAHAIGLIHRDIKPANIMLTCRGGVPDFAKVLDFGLAKDTEAENAMTVTVANAIAGTPLYFSPEATKGANNLDQRSDIYSLGVVAYEMLTGRPPFQGDSPIDICMKHATKQPPALSENTSQPIAPRLDELIMQCLEKAPEERPQTAIELRDRIEEIAAADVTWSNREANDWWKNLHHRDSETVQPGEAETALF